MKKEFKKKKNNQYTAPIPMFKKTIQDSIPIQTVHEKENLIETYNGMYTRSYILKENNYQSETEEKEQDMYINYRKVLNSLGSNEIYQLTIMNRNVDMRDVEENVLMKETGDNFDGLRREYNDITLGRIKQGRNGLEKLKYFTIGLKTDTLKKASDVFDKSLNRRLSESFKRLESDAIPVPIEKKLEILHDIYNIDSQGTFLSYQKKLNPKTGMVDDKASFDFENMRSQGCTVKDMIAPSSFRVVKQNHCLQFGKNYVKTFRVSDFPATLRDDFFCKLTDVDFNILTTATISPISQVEARKLVHTNLILARNEVSDQRKELIKNNMPEEMVSDELKDKVEVAQGMREEMTKNDERLYKIVYTITLWAKSPEELKEHSDTIVTFCQTDGLVLDPLEDMQEEGFNTCIPLCDNEMPLQFQRTMKSTSAAIFFPFSNLELCDKNGINYSCNLYSKNLIVYDRTQSQNFNGFFLGTPGSGKSLAAKLEMLSVFLKSNSDCIIIDPEAEYGAITKLLHGQEIKIEPHGRWHINPLEISTEYEWDNEDDTEVTNPVFAKCTFIIRLIETMLGENSPITPTQKSIIDECTRQLYAPFVDDNGFLNIPKEKMPTLIDLYHAFVIKAKSVPEARDLAYCLKLYTEGSLNTFAFQSNVDTNNRFITYNIRDCGEELKPLAMMIILDSLFTTMFKNKRFGKFTWIWIDEIYLMFQSEKSATTLNEIFKRSRKHGGVPTGITQNVEDLLESDTARKMLSNCNFVQILNQDPSDREHLRELLNLSQSQVDVITSAPKGQGLIYTGDNVVPFYSVFPKNNSIFRCLVSNIKELKELEEEELRKKMHDAKIEKKQSLVS